MEVVVYLLGALASGACAVLLLRAYRAKRIPLLLWSGLCFSGYVLNNVLLCVSALIPTINVYVWQTLPAALGLGVLVYGLVWMDPS